MSLQFTKHAIERALDMDVPGDEIRACYERPTNTYLSRKHDSYTFQRGRLALAIRRDQETGDDVVLTVLWATAEAWEHDYQQGAVADRPPRDDLSHLYNAAKP
jgi:hypothetical protein